MKLQFGYILFVLLCLTLTSCENVDKRNSIFNTQIGNYCIDLDRTFLSSYTEDSIAYRNLKIVFRSDSTFSLNFKVPFIFDTTGTWIPSKGGVEDWNYLRYQKSAITTQFSVQFENNNLFYLNSTTPEKGREVLQRIYFKRCSEDK